MTALSVSVDANASLTLALQKIDRARRALDARNSGTAKLELSLAVLAIEDARSLLPAVQQETR